MNRQELRVAIIAVLCLPLFYVSSAEAQRLRRILRRNNNCTNCCPTCGITPGVTVDQGATVSLDGAVQSSSIMESPIVSSPIVESPIISSQVVESPIVSSPVIDSSVISSPIESVDSTVQPYYGEPIQSPISSEYAMPVEPSFAPSVEPTFAAEPSFAVSSVESYPTVEPAISMGTESYAEPVVSEPSFSTGGEFMPATFEIANECSTCGPTVAQAGFVGQEIASPMPVEMSSPMEISSPVPSAGFVEFPVETAMVGGNVFEGSIMPTAEIGSGYVSGGAVQGCVDGNCGGVVMDGGIPQNLDVQTTQTFPSGFESQSFESPIVSGGSISGGSVEQIISSEIISETPIESTGSVETTESTESQSDTTQESSDPPVDKVPDAPSESPNDKEA